MKRRSVPRAVVVVVVAACSACATAPVLMPAAPMGASVVEAGAAVVVLGGGSLPAGGGIGDDISPNIELGGGGAGFVDVQIAPEFHLIGSGHTTYLRALDPGASAPQRIVGGGRVGARWLKPLLGDTTYLGAEALVGYLGTGGLTATSTQHFVTAQVGLPVAEAAPLKGLWIYTAPSVGLAIPLHGNAEVPFVGVFEIPLGLSWELTSNLVLIAEAGLSMPAQGPYGTVGLAFRL